MKQGKAKILVHNDGVHPEDPLLRQKVKQTKVVSRGDGFGEIALFYGERRSASVFAVDDCETYIIDAKTFHQYVVLSKVQRLAGKANYLESFNLFNCLDNYQKLNLFEGFETVTFKKGQNIVTEGEKGDAFYVIEKGVCEAIKIVEVNGKKNELF
jgi:CRP-like cAMP-binding protein